MEKSTTLNLRINPETKKNAEQVLSQLGLPMATAIDIFLKQVALTGSIPFTIALPRVPEAINTDHMSVLQIREALDEGLTDIESGRYRLARGLVQRAKEGLSDEEI